jgi:hypothetical protein
VAKRSPILGFNHNIRHRGLVFHVQTEDSGLSNPHIFTHLFHGGVIISTRKLVYDPEAADDVVKGLMQAQHKAVLKELKDGKFTDKINQYLGSHPDLQPFDPGADTASAERTQPTPKISLDDLTPPPQPLPQPPPQAIPDEVTEPVLLLRQEDTKREKPPARPKTESGPVVQIHSPAPPSAPEPPGMEKSGAYSQHRRKGDSSERVPTVTFTPQAPPPAPPAPRPPTVPPAGSRSASRPIPQPTAAGKSGGVVVSRPAVIVGAPPRVVGGATKDTQKRGKTEMGGPGQRKPDTLFGQGLISEKSLDEVILAYLSEDTDEE